MPIHVALAIVESRGGGGDDEPRAKGERDGKTGTRAAGLAPAWPCSMLPLSRASVVAPPWPPPQPLAAWAEFTECRGLEEPLGHLAGVGGGGPVGNLERGRVDGGTGAGLGLLGRAGRAHCGGKYPPGAGGREGLGGEGSCSVPLPLTSPPAAAVTWSLESGPSSHRQSITSTLVIHPVPSPESSR